MLYAALIFWLLVIVFSAWAVHSLWSDVVKPRAVNTVLLPGTLVAQLGHVLGLLVTGNPVRNTALMSDDESGEPQSDTPDRQRIPILGSVVVGLLPLLACGVGLYVTAQLWGRSIVQPAVEGSAVTVSRQLPLSLDAFWDMLRNSVTATQNMLNAILSSNLSDWRTLLFLYLAVCLTVRMTPFEGNRRGAIGAILLSGVVIAVLGAISPRVEQFLDSSWPLLSFAVGMLLFLLIVSLIVTGVVGLVRILAGNE
jgi:hypothetical protein